MREKRVPLIPLQPLDLQIPYHFRCPISLDLMRDPVTVSTGQTYDRRSIDTWLATGNSSCPVSRAPLEDFSLIPNHTLRRLIQDWCVANRSFGVDRIPTPKQPAEPALVRSLLNQAASGLNTVHVRLAALRRLRGLARDSEKNQSLISSLNIRSIVLPVIFSESDSDELRNESLMILTEFPISDEACISIASDSSKIEYLIELLLHGASIDVRVNSAALIESIIAGATTSDLRSSITDSDNLFTGVIRILTDPSVPSPRALKVGVKTLFALSLNKHHRHRAVAAGAVDALIGRFPELDKSDCERALATMELLCRIPEGSEAFGSHALTVPLLVKTILKVSNRATEYAAGALLVLCSSSEKLQREAVNAGVLTQLLLLVQSECTERAKRKAQMLLKVLRDSWPEKRIGNNNNNNNNNKDELYCRLSATSPGLDIRWKGISFGMGP